MKNNKFIIAAAGSGKTELLVNEALKINQKNVIISTFTESNRDEIKNKILMIKKFIPKNITIQTWFSFLLQHGVRPYQSVVNDLLHNRRIGFYLYQGKSAPYSSALDIFRHYFTKDLKIYSDKISKFVYECNELSQQEVINRISRIYPNIFLDEIQDFAGWDLDILKLFLKSNSRVIMVGDPRQSIYDTNDSPKYKKYRGCGIQNFIKDKCGDNLCAIDTGILTRSHRNNDSICNFSSKLYPQLPASKSCNCTKCRIISKHDGIFLIKERDVEAYLKKYPDVMQLRLKSTTKRVNENYSVLNFGLSKGLTFDRTLIYPTKDMENWLLNNSSRLADKTKAQFYVAITRAKYSVGIVYNYDERFKIGGVNKYKIN